jgi:uncharacterized protein
MSSESLSLVFRKVGQFSQSNGIHNISILWHGGEAMIMGPSFYREVRDLEKEYLGHARVDHSMQTNASMYRGETREILSKLLTAGVVGGCFDPFHPTRPLASGGDSFRESLQGYYALKKDNLRVSLIYVVHKKSLDLVRDLYFFYKNLRVSGIQFSPLKDFSDPEYYLSPEDWGLFLIHLWDIWEKDGYALTVWPLRYWLNLLLYGKSITCCEFGDLRDQRQLSISIAPWGDLYPCPRFLDKEMFRIGNIHQMTFEEIASHERTHLLAEKKKSLNMECLSCMFLQLCNSGCAVNHDASGKTLWCRGQRLLFEHLTTKEALWNDHLQRTSASPGCIQR